MQITSRGWPYGSMWDHMPLLNCLDSAEITCSDGTLTNNGAGNDQPSHAVCKAIIIIIIIIIIISGILWCLMSFEI